MVVSQQKDHSFQVMKSWANDLDNFEVYPHDPMETYDASPADVGFCSAQNSFDVYHYTPSGMLLSGND